MRDRQTDSIRSVRITRVENSENIQVRRGMPSCRGWKPMSWRDRAGEEPRRLLARTLLYWESLEPSMALTR